MDVVANPGSGSRSQALASQDTLVKISQRPSKSCTECIRRKTRCNKQVPCDMCVKRGVRHLCRMEAQYRLGSETPSRINEVPVSGHTAFEQHVMEEIKLLRNRVAELERFSPRPLIGQSSRPTLSMAHSTGRDTPNSYEYNGEFDLHTEPQADALHRGVKDAKTRHLARDASLNSAPVDVEQVEDAATTLEFFALGLDRRVGSESLASNRKRNASRHRRGSRTRLQRRSHICQGSHFPNTPESIKDALLLPSTVKQILAFAESHVSWQHCCVHFPDLWTEVDQFWTVLGGSSGEWPDNSEGWAAVEPTWVALLYAIMGIAIHQMDGNDALRCGLSDADRLVLPNALISAAEDALHHGSFLSVPTLWTVQTIAILTLCGHNVCESDLLSSLLAIGIKMAHTLGLHKLGGPARALKARAESGENSETDYVKEHLIEIELGKRIWWALVQEDWFAIPFRGVWAIQPDHFDTPEPSNCHETDLEMGRFTSRPEDQVTVAYKQLISSRMAVVVRDVFHKIRHAPEDRLSAIVNDAVTRVNHILGSLPPSLHSLRSSARDIPDQPAYFAAMRHYIQISARHKILIIHRALLAHGGSADERRRAHTACVENAQHIIEELELGQVMGEGNMQSFWTIPYHGLAAAVVLALDWISIRRETSTRSEVVDARRREVQRARRVLERLAPTSRIARRGIKVLSDVMREAETFNRGKKRGSDGAVLRMVRNINVPANELVEEDRSSSTGDEEQIPASSTLNRHDNDASILYRTPHEPSQLKNDSENAIESLPFPPASVANFNMDFQPGFNESHSDWGTHCDADALSVSPTWNEGFGLTQDETNQLLASLQENLPDVGRLFDGSIGTFGWT